jgi:hypothetical protein
MYIFMLIKLKINLKNLRIHGGKLFILVNLPNQDGRIRDSCSNEVYGEVRRLRLL